MKEQQLLEQLLEKQSRYAKWQCILTAAAAVVGIAIFVLLLTVVPHIKGVVGQMEAVLGDLEAITGQVEGQMDNILGNLSDLSGQMDTVLNNLDTVTSELAQADLKGMVEDVDTFVTTGQHAVEQVTEKLNILDFETLNSAIKNLSEVVEPLARLFNVFH